MAKKIISGTISITPKTYLDKCYKLIHEARSKIYPANLDYRVTIVLPEDEERMLRYFLMQNYGKYEFLTGIIKDPRTNFQASFDTLFGAHILTSPILKTPVVF